MSQPPPWQPQQPPNNQPQWGQPPPQQLQQPLPPQQYTQYTQPPPPPGYPPQYPQLQPYPPQRPKRTFMQWYRAQMPFARVGLIVAAIFVLSAVIYGAATSYTTTSRDAVNPTPTQIVQNQPVATTAPQPTDTPAPTPTPAPKWTTTHTFTGNGTKKTAIFTAPEDWKINWTCSPNSFYGGEYNVQVFVYGSDGSLVDVAVNTICKAGNTGDSTEEHQGGQVYLDINSEAAWTIQVQELK